MLLALGATAIVILALLWEVVVPALERRLQRRRVHRRRIVATGYDPGRERRAEQRARALLKSCVNAEEWEMYRDLGFLRVWGASGEGPGGHSADGGVTGAPYAYLIYPHKPIVAFIPQTGALLSEYCIEFLDRSPDDGGRLPESDDVLAKWMALTGDERRMIDQANMHLPGRQVDPRQVRRDLWRLGRWERERMRRYGSHAGSVGSR